MAERPMHPLVRAALCACPREYVREYRDEIALDARSARYGHAAVAFDVLRHGVTMRAENALRDVRLAVRSLARAPLYTAVCAGTIALAVAANVAVTSVLDAVVLHPLPFAHADRLVAFGPVTEGLRGITTIPYHDALEIGARSSTLDVASVYQRTSSTLFRGGRPAAVRGLVVSAGYFAMLGEPPQLGRLLGVRDSGRRSIVVSDRLWRTALGADPRAIGSRLRLGDDTYTVVGINGAQYRDPVIETLETYDYWIPLDPHSDVALGRSRYAFWAFALLKPGVSVAAADADVRRVMQALVRADPGSHAGNRGAIVVPVTEYVLGPARPLLWLLDIAVGVVLLIACANVGNLGFVRASARSGENVIRAALGASRARLAAQSFAEALVLAVAGGVTGTLGAAAALRLLAPLIATLPRANDVAVNGTMLLYAGAVIATVSLVTGGIPAASVRRDIAGALKATGRGSDRSAMKRARFAMVAFEVALAMAVTISAGLVVRSFVALVSTPTGIDARNVAEMPLGVVPPRDAGEGRFPTFVRRLEAAVRAIPGVAVVAAASGTVPFTSGGLTSVTVPAGHGRPMLETTAAVTDVGPEYFMVLRVPMLAGRAFSSADRESSAPIAVVNERFARQFFGTVDVVGRSIAADWTADGKHLSRTVVGVVANVRSAFDAPAVPAFYRPIAQTSPDGSYVRIMIRTTGPIRDLAGLVTSALRGVEPELAPPALQPLEALMARNALRARAAMTLFGILACVAVLLALAGMYSVSAYAVETRTREFGLRKAVGAPDGDVFRSVLASAVGQASAGIAGGVVITAVAAPMLGALLFGTSPSDPLTFSAAAAALLAFTAGAALVPALRATRLAPAAALRYE